MATKRTKKESTTKKEEPMEKLLQNLENLREKVHDQFTKAEEAGFIWLSVSFKNTENVIDAYIKNFKEVISSPPIKRRALVTAAAIKGSKNPATA